MQNATAARFSPANPLMKPLMYKSIFGNKLVERPNTSYMMKKLDPLEFNRQRHKSSLLPGPDLLLTLFINMIFERTF